MTQTALLKFLEPLPDEAILGLTLYGEARGEPIEGILAVGCVIRNRVLADLKGDGKPDWWGEGYRGVCLKPFQFSVWNVKDPDSNHQHLMTVAAKLKAIEVMSPLFEQCAWAALGISRGAILDTVKGANHYHTIQMKPRPSWAQSYAPVMQKGNHIFYRL